jgi:hypothetical protein
MIIGSVQRARRRQRRLLGVDNSKKRGALIG